MLLENVKRLCAEKGITIQKLEMAVGLGNGVIGKWEDRNPRIDTVKKVADFFGTTVDKLLSDDGRKNNG